MSSSSSRMGGSLLRLCERRKGALTTLAATSLVSFPGPIIMASPPNVVLYVIRVLFTTSQVSPSLHPGQRFSSPHLTRRSTRLLRLTIIVYSVHTLFFSSRASLSLSLYSRASSRLSSSYPSPRRFFPTFTIHAEDSTKGSVTSLFLAVLNYIIRQAIVKTNPVAIQ